MQDKENAYEAVINYNYILKKEVFMPGFNQTGPMGQGPMTGRRMGKCTNFGAEKKSIEHR